jgi:hypothetical protein
MDKSKELNFMAEEIKKQKAEDFPYCLSGESKSASVYIHTYVIKYINSDNAESHGTVIQPK